MISFRYREKDTPIHHLNPLCKIAWVSAIFILALIFDHPVYLLSLFLSTVPIVIYGRIRKEWTSLMKFSLYLCLTIIVVNTLVNNNGVHVLWRPPFRIPLLGNPAITLEAIFFGAGMSLRLVAILSAFAVLTLTVHPDDLMLAMIKMKLPYKSVLVTSLATRFVPLLIHDAERITDVQKSRGLDFEYGSLIQRTGNRMAVLIPLLSNSLDRAVQVAEAMESRAFGSGEKRSFYKELRLSKLDILMLMVSFLTVVLGIFMRLRGMGDYAYFPALVEMSFSGAELFMLFWLVFLLFLIVPVAWLKKRLELD